MKSKCNCECCCNKKETLSWEREKRQPRDYREIVEEAVRITLLELRENKNR
jgi:hypothetical protein